MQIFYLYLLILLQWFKVQSPESDCLVLDLSVDVRHWIEPLTTQGSSFCKMDVRVNLPQRTEGRLGGFSHEQRPGASLAMTVLIDLIQQTQRVRGGQPSSWKLLLAVQRTSKRRTILGAGHPLCLAVSAGEKQQHTHFPFPCPEQTPGVSVLQLHVFSDLFSVHAWEQRWAGIMKA